MRLNALLVKINGIPEVLLIIDHFEMGIMGKAIGSIGVFILDGLIVDLNLDGIVNWRKPFYPLVARPYRFFPLPKIPDRLVLIAFVR